VRVRSLPICNRPSFPRLFPVNMLYIMRIAFLFCCFRIRFACFIFSLNALTQCKWQLYCPFVMSQLFMLSIFWKLSLSVSSQKLLQYTNVQLKFTIPLNYSKKLKHFLVKFKNQVTLLHITSLGQNNTRLISRQNRHHRLSYVRFGLHKNIPLP